MKAIVVPGNHDTEPTEFWLPYVKAILEEKGIEVTAEKMPDPYLARREYWMPFIEKKLGGDENAVIVGHSSGGLAAMRYAEKHQLQGLVLVGVCHTDMDDPDEKKSGYFDDPWNWEKIRENTDWIIQFHGTEDSYVPIEEARHVAEKLGSEYHEVEDAGHFIEGIYEDSFPLLREKLEEKF